MDYKKRMTKLRENFLDLFGDGGGDCHFFAAPGRVNLIGEHIDYCGGFVFPAALTLDSLVCVRKNNTMTLNLAATDLEGIYKVDLNDIEKAKELKWGNYQAGVAKELIEMGYELEGLDMVFDISVPFGAGLSSSASIELVTAFALAKVFSDKEVNLVDLALAGQRAENNFVGVKCGIMDQFASAMGKKDHAILLDCDTLDYEYIPLELGDYLLVLANTNVKHKLGDSKYNERRREVDFGLELIHQSNLIDKRKYLCNYSKDEFDRFEDIFADEIIRNRVKHVIYENERVKEAAKLLKAGHLIEFGKLLADANDSIRYLYEVTGFELDTMIDLAKLEEGCIGARMTGAGFGGSTLNIVHKDYVDSFISSLKEKYKEKTGINPSFYICSAGDGAREVFVNN